MAQFVYTMNRVGKVVPPKREILKNISFSIEKGEMTPKMSIVRKVVENNYSEIINGMYN